MKINLNDVLNNSYDRSIKEIIIIYDDKGNFYEFVESNIPDRVKQMKVDRFDIVSEKLVVIKVIGEIKWKELYMTMWKKYIIQYHVVIIYYVLYVKTINYAKH